MRQLVAIVGPTATGKTALGIHLARHFQGEVVNADSRQVYRHMDIGTAKPTPQEQAQVPHHLLDVVDPDEPFSLGQWLELARGALADIWARGKIPFLVGGTGQYVWALLEGWTVPKVPPQPQWREEMAAWAAQHGPQALHRELALRDPEAARLIDPRNVRRVIRALEVIRATGSPFSQLRRKEGPGFSYLCIGLWLPREELYRRIDQRVDQMIASGLVDEVRRLLAMGYSCRLPSMSGIGYKEICRHLAGEIDLATAVARIKWETHRLVRHQENWFRRTDPRIHWLRADDPNLSEKAKDLVAAFLLGTKETVGPCAS
jgi:tRNA dimethylallyltransferase